MNEIAVEIRNSYVLECLRQENKINFNTELKEIEKIIAQRSRSTKKEKKIIKMSDATSYLFPNVYLTTLDPNRFTAELACKLNEIIGKDLFENLGKYRESQVAPLNVDIISKMNNLFKNTRAYLQSKLLSKFI